MQRPGVGLRTQFHPRLTLGKTWGSQPSRSENQKPLPLHWGQMQKQRSQQAVRSGKEPFSSWGVAKPSAWPRASCLRPGHTVPAKVGSAPLSLALGLPDLLTPSPETWPQDGSTFWIHFQIYSRSHPWAVFPSRGQGQGGRATGGGQGRIPKGGGLSTFTPAPGSRSCSGCGSMADHLNSNWVNAGLDQKGTWKPFSPVISQRLKVFVLGEGEAQRPGRTCPTC